MSSTSYQPLPQSPPTPTQSRKASHSPNNDEDEEHTTGTTAAKTHLQNRHLLNSLNADPRFVQPTPALWKRIGLIAFVGALFWMAFLMRFRMVVPEGGRVVHANRYSKQHKFRPAASPVVTERLKDGRVRVRGAQPTA